MTNDLLAMRDWLWAERVTVVGMEATGAYWKPVFYLLEQDVECWLLNARRMKAVPGRKTDVKDSKWIAELVEHGLVRPSFVPPEPVRQLRDLTRYRTEIVRERTREVQRLEKLLEDAGVKLSVVVLDLTGKSARAMLEALLGGARDPAVLAELARGSLRGRRPVPAEALTGRFTAHHAFLARAMLDRIDAATAMEQRLSTQIDQAMRPFRRQLELITTIPGVSARAWPHPPRRPLAEGHAGPGRLRGLPHQGHPPGHPLPAHRHPPRQETRPGRRRPQHPDRHLGHAHPRCRSPRPGPRPLHRPAQPARQGPQTRRLIDQLHQLGYQVTVQPAQAARPDHNDRPIFVPAGRRR
jgi:transposase